MSTQSENTKRIAKNTLMLYTRMLFSMLVSLYTSRVVLNTLGVEDYGIYNVVGGFVAMFALISEALSGAVVRFFTFELGEGNIERLKRVFSTSFFIHVMLALLVLVLSETIGVWFLNTHMTIPPERLHAANWVFQASILSFMLGLLSVSFNAIIIAYERMNIFAYIGILDTILRLLIVLFIAYIPFVWDNLIIYSTLLVLVGILIQSIYLYYCKTHFQECQLHFTFDKQFFKGIGSFASWGFIGSTSVVLRDQGVNILLNLFYGATLNAAKGIANTVNVVVNSFVNNFMVSLSPQITISYAKGDKLFLTSLLERGTRFSFYILLFLAMPIFIETDYVLTLWLKQYPEHSVNFVRIVLLTSMCEVLSKTITSAQSASGNIKYYQLTVGGMSLLNLPLSYILLIMKYPPESVLYVTLIISIICFFLRLLIVSRTINISFVNYIVGVCCNVLLVAILSYCIPFACYKFMPYGFLRFLFVFVSSAINICIFAYWIGLSQSERLYLRTVIKSKLFRNTIKQC
ncbi:MAG: oligosaccharide flippase family protein [Bacteroides sp.]|nr:oligosaccharide flippase family protein [Bacteroides sp.]MCM1447755.1 oligosaccharide flippase family protein [Bacteroides sp.]